MRRQYILDTSALIHDPMAWKHYPDSDVILPISVLNELDNLKKGSAESSRNARVAIRLLDEISEKGDISTGILLDKDDIMLRVDANYVDLTDVSYNTFGDPTYGDTQILVCAYTHWLSNRDTTLVSDDINLRIKAKARGIDAIACEGDRHSLSDLYSGVQVVIDEEVGAALLRHGSIDPRTYGLTLRPNECILFESDGGDTIAMGRLVKSDRLKIVKKRYPWGLAARNMEQSFLIDLIMDKNVDLVTAIGTAGTGKSLVALAGAIELVINRREYEKLIIYKPIESVGKDLGYLPGTAAEKLAPYFVSIMDNLEILFSNKNGNDWKKDLEMFQRKGRIEMDAIAYVRGRSIPNSIILVDEAQNLSTSEIKTILTRAGEESKIILTGDIDQIDRKDLDATDNGLTSVIEKFKNSLMGGHITLTKGERSRLATEAAKIL